MFPQHMTVAGPGGDEQQKGGQVAPVKWWQGRRTNPELFHAEKVRKCRCWVQVSDYNTVNFRSLILHLMHFLKVSADALYICMPWPCSITVIIHFSDPELPESHLAAWLLETTLQLKFSSSNPSSQAFGYCRNMAVSIVYLFESHKVQSKETTTLPYNYFKHILLKLHVSVCEV